MRRGRWLTLWLAVVGSLFGPATVGAQVSQAPILIVDRERVLRESAEAVGLGEEERQARHALKVELDALRAALEAEEAEIAALRDGSPDIFEARVREFDQKVRAARLESQQKSEALQMRFAEVRSQLSLALEPVLQKLMAESGASLILDARTVMVARPGADVTSEAIERMKEAALAIGGVTGTASEQ